MLMTALERTPWGAVFTLCLCASTTHAATHIYGASETASAWTASGSKFTCTLSHEIPYYGEVRFEQRAGEALTVAITVEREPVEAGSARLLAEPPPWKSHADVRDLGRLEYVAGTAPFRYPRAIAARLMLELEEGMFPTLEYADWADGEDEIRVYISAVNYKPALQGFLRCTETLLPVSYAELKTLHLRFDSGSARLDQNARVMLGYLAEYVLADEAPPTVSVEGHTDYVGTDIANLLLSERRAEAVKAYLVSRGIDTAQIGVQFLGESRPLQSNKTVQGRAANRRVLVRVSD